MLCQPRHLSVMALAAALALPAVGTANAGTSTATSPTCSAQQLTLSWTDTGTARPDGTGNQDTAIVRVHNKGSTTCTLQGYPQVTLKARHETETLRDTPRAKPRTVTLARGEETTFTIVFLSEKGEPSQAIKPDTVDITPPGATKPTSLEWRWGPVTRQEGATHPGNYVGAVGRSLTP